MKWGLFEDLLLALVFIVVIMVVTTQPSVAGEHRVYIGTAWTHLSNVDAGIPFNDDYEDNGDHVGIDAEYQYVHDSGNYLFASFGVGYTVMHTKYQNGWDCSGCALPSVLRFGFKWRIK